MRCRLGTGLSWICRSALFLPSVLCVLFTAPLLIDQLAVETLVQYVCDCLTGSCEFMETFDSPSESGMNLLVVSERIRNS